MNTTKKEEIINLLELKPIEDAKLEEGTFFSLQLPDRYLTIVLNKVVIIRQLLQENKFKTLIYTEENKVSDVDDMKLLLNFVLNYEEVLYINKLIIKNKNKK